MTPKDRSKTEDAPLLDGESQTRCCFGQLRVQGSDGIWSWVVAFANFMVNFIIVGLGRMSGLLYVEFMFLFDIDRRTASIPFSIQQAGRNLFGPIAGILGQKYGMRAVTVAGGLIGSLSAAAAYFKMDITSITILWGLFFGISTALTTTLSQVSVDQYFEKHRATAGGFAFSGGCIGAFFFPIVLETLIENYGMRGTFLVLGAIILHTVPAAMMLSEPPWERDLVDKKTVTQTTTCYGACNGSEPSSSDNSVDEMKAKNKLTEAGRINPLPIYVDFMLLQANSDMVFQYLTMEISDTTLTPKFHQNVASRLDKQRLLNELECVYSSVANLELTQNDTDVSVIGEKDKNERSSKFISVNFKINDAKNGVKERSESSRKVYDDIPRKVYIQTKLKEIYDAKGAQLVSHFPYWEQPRAWKILIELRQLYDALTDKIYLQTTLKNTQNFSPSEHKPADELKNKNNAKDNPDTFCNLIKTAIKLHGNPLFLLICLCRGVFMLTFIPVVTIIVDFAMDKGLQKSDGKYIIATLSMGDLIGRLCLGWVTDRGCLSLQKYMLFGMVILGASTGSLPLITSPPAFVAAVLFFGILQGSLFVRHPLLVSQYMKKHEHAIGMGFINLLSGFLGFALPSFIGYFRDTLGSYHQMFYLNGIICAAVGMIWILEPLFVAINNSRCAKSGKTPLKI